MCVCVCICLYMSTLSLEGHKQLIMVVLVCSGCCNKIPQTGWLTNNRNLFLTVLEVEKSKIKVPAWPHSGENPLHGSQLKAFPCIFI